MAQEDKSVRKIVQEIEARTGKLDGAIEKLSDSLNKISESLAKPKEEDGPGREDLIKKFKQPFATPDSVKTESNSDELLDQIKDALVFNQKDNFALFKSIDATLKKIEDKGGTLGGGFDIGVGGRGGKGKGKAPAAKAASVKGGVPDKAAKKGTEKAAGGMLSKVGSGLAKAAKFGIPGLALGMAGYDAVTGAMDAEKVLGIEDREATFGERVSSGLGGLTEGLTFGMVGRETAAKGIESARQGVMSFFGMGGDEEKKAEAASSAPAAAAAAVAPTLSKPKPTASSEPKVKPASTEKTTTNFSKEYLEKVVSGEHPKPLISKEKASEILKSGSFATPAAVIPATSMSGEEGAPAQFSKEYLEKVISGEHPRPLLTKEKADELLKQQEQVVPQTLQVSPTSSSTTPAQTVNDISQENADMKEGGQAAQPVVINNSSSVATNTQTFTPLKAAARPNASSFERKQNMAASY